MATNGISDDFIECEVRVAVLSPDGEISEGDDNLLSSYGGSIPAVGDYLASLWPEWPGDDYEIFQVIERVHVAEFDVGAYWLLLVREIDYAPRFEKLFAHARAISERERSILRNRSETRAKAMQLTLAGKTKAKKKTVKRQLKPNRKP
jgi:hypothetical protein